MTLPEPAIALSTCRAADAAPRRDSVRPPALRNAAYAGQYDWDTVFYDVYRVGEHIVFQGPPLLNFARLLRESGYFRKALRPLVGNGTLVERNRGSEIWVRDSAASIDFDCPLGSFAVPVRPNLSTRFAGRRVVHTLSKDNDPRWIADWARFYARVHGADGVLVYDNASAAYDAGELEARLVADLPDMAITVVDWRFRYGPQGGMAGAVGAVETAWDSDFCQTGSLQHARFRFLNQAKSVLNVDIDELVLSPDGTSIFAATEASPARFTKFAGRWISSTTPRPVSRADCRHADFTLSDGADAGECPPKWCVVPDARLWRRETWSVHNLFGSPHNRTISRAFAYRHMKAISNNWKNDRREGGAYDAVRFCEDTALAAAFAAAGMATAPA